MSTTIIDKLIVTLGLDGKAFKKGSADAEKAQKGLEETAKKSNKNISDSEKKLAEEQRKRAKEMKARSKAIAQGLNKIRNEALGLLTVFMGGVGLKSFTENTISAEAGLSRMSANLGISAKDLAEWKLANEKAGGSAEGMVSQLKESTNEIARYKLGLGVSESMQQFFRYGGSSESLKDGNTYLKARADIIARIYKTDPSRAMAIAKAMGVDEDTFNLLKQGSVEVEKLRDAQSTLADDLAKNAANAERFRQELVQLKYQLTDIGVRLLTYVMPALERLTTWLSSSSGQMTAWIDNLKESAPFVIGLLDMISDGWKNIFDWATAAGKAIQKAIPSSWSDWIGKAVATVMAKGGSTEAKNALAINEGGIKSNPRNIRNNNPGNIEYGAFAKAHGAIGSDGRFAIFSSMAAGQAAQIALLQYGKNYFGGGNDTIAGIISKWAPSSDNNNTAAYIADVSRQLHMDSGQHLSIAQIPMLAAAMARHEGSGSTSNSSHADVKIGNINIQTQATDAVGISKTIGGAVSRYSFVPQINTGMH